MDIHEREGQLSLFVDRLEVEPTAVSVCESEKSTTEENAISVPEEQTEKLPVKKWLLRAKRDPAIDVELRQYKNKETNRNQRQFRYRLTLVKDPRCYVEHYCDSEEDAIAWVKGHGKWGKKSGEDRLFEKFDISKLHDIPPNIRFQSLVSGLSTIGESGAKMYFDRHPDLLRELSQKPINTLTETECNEAIRSVIASEEERKIAIAEINKVFGACRIRNVKVPPALRYESSTKKDKYLRALRGALQQWVLTEEMCRAIYCTCVDMIPKDPHYLAVGLMLTTGISLSEVCALRWRDLTGLCCIDPGTGPWSAPKEDIWMIRIRRFCRQEHTEGGVKCVIRSVGDINRYRLLVIAPHAKELLERYVNCYGSEATGKDPLIPAKGKSSDTILYAVRKLAGEVLKMHGSEKLLRKVHLRSLDGVHSDRVLGLLPDIRAFAHTVECRLKEHEMEEFRIRAYMGKSPMSVLAGHYWEPKVRMELLRQYGEISRWDLRVKPPQGLPVRIDKCAKMVEGDLQAPLGYVRDAVMSICGDKGCGVQVELKERYGYSCAYTVLHSVQKTEQCGEGFAFVRQGSSAEAI